MTAAQMLRVEGFEVAIKELRRVVVVQRVVRIVVLLEHLGRDESDASVVRAGLLEMRRAGFGAFRRDASLRFGGGHGRAVSAAQANCHRPCHQH